MRPGCKYPGKEMILKVSKKKKSKQVKKNVRLQIMEDGSQISGSGVHFSVLTGETPSQSSEEQSEQPTGSQHI